MARLTNAQLITRGHERNEIVLLRSDIIDRDHDVNNWLSCQSGNRSRSDVFDLDWRRPKHVPQSCLRFKKNTHPALVIPNQFEMPLFRSVDKLDSFNVFAPASKIVHHLATLPSRRCLPPNKPPCRLSAHGLPYVS